MRLSRCRRRRLWKGCRIGIVLLVTGAGWLACADEFPAVHDTQKTAPPVTTPAEALAAIKAPDGFHVSLFASEPDVRQPIAMTTDARGRLWVAENYTYAEAPSKLDDRHRDRIIILEDADGDGRSDGRKVFWDQARQLTSVEVGLGGVWALCPPQLLFIPDRNGDDVPDGPPEVILDGFDFAVGNRHNFANGLKWGPDGWLYGRNGISNDGHVGPPGTSPEQRTFVPPGIWRVHPVQHRMEVVCAGTTNPWGHDWDEHGELFMINTVIGHLWHCVPGAHFKRMFGADANPYVYDLIDQTADHVHWDAQEAWLDVRKGVSETTAQAGGGHAHSGLLIYQGANWPEQYRGKMFTVNLHGQRLNCDRLERLGAAYVGRHEPDFLFSADPYFRALELLSGPDGGVFIADWSDVGECHENDGVVRSTGRIFKVRFADNSSNSQGASARLDLGRLSNAELVSLLKHPNDWYPRQARRLLQERTIAGQKMQDARAELHQLVESATEPRVKLRALWGLHAIQGLDDEQLLTQLAADNEHVRIWAIRLLADDGAISDQAVQALTRQAAGDSSGLVLLYLASTLQKLSGDSRWALAEALGARQDFADDRVLPLMLWYGIEGAVPGHSQQAIALATHSQVPLLRRYVARRLTQDIHTHPEPVSDLVAALAKVSDPVHQLDILTGMNEALLGYRKVSPPAAWPALQTAAAKSPDPQVQALVRELSVVFGDGRAMDELKAIARSQTHPVEARQAAVQTLAEARVEGLQPLLIELLADRDISAAAVRGLSVVGDARAAEVLVNRYGDLSPPGREAAVAALAARPQSALVLVEAIQARKIGRVQVELALIRQMQNYEDPKLQEALSRLWPDLRPISADKKKRIEELKTRLTADVLQGADRSAGRALWEKSCAKCHTLFGSGGKIGPDLTGAQRSNLDYLLENIVDPSAALAPNFRTTLIALADGRVLNGVVLTKTDQVWDVQTATDRLIVPAGDIETARESRQSLMPEGQLDLLQPDDVRNLIAYLMSGRQVDLPVSTGQQ